MDGRRPAAGSPAAASDHEGGRRNESHRDGELSSAWRLIVALAWIAAFFAYAAVWQTSVQIGISTWWVGPRSAPPAIWIRVLPFVVTILAVLLVVYNVRRVVEACTALGASTALIALPDLSRSVGLAVLELIISAALIAVGAAAFTGRYRLAPAPAPADDGVSDPHGGAPSDPDRIAPPNGG